MRIIQLSVSSAILATIISGCSQSELVSNLPADSFYESDAHRAMRLASLKGNSSLKEKQDKRDKSDTQQAEQKVKLIPVQNVYKPEAQKISFFNYKKPHPSHSVTKKIISANIKPDQCRVKVKSPAKYITKTRRVFIQKASVKRILIRAPQYRWVNKKILVRKPSYKTRTILPAQYKTRTTRVRVKPASYAWSKGRGEVNRRDSKTGKMMHLVKVPAQYKTVKKQYLYRPAKISRTLIPAVYKTVRYKKRISDAIYKTVQKPAKYKLKKYRVKVSAERYVWQSGSCKGKTTRHLVQKHKTATLTNIVAKQTKKSHKQTTNKQNASLLRQYQKTVLLKKPVIRKQIAESGYMQLDPLKKNTFRVKNIKPELSIKAKKSAKAEKSADKKKRLVVSIQKSLKKKGFYPGAIDGKLGAWTAAALQAFQSSQGLPVGKLNKETFVALGMIRS